MDSETKHEIAKTVILPALKKYEDGTLINVSEDIAKRTLEEESVKKVVKYLSDRWIGNTIQSVENYEAIQTFASSLQPLLNKEQIAQLESEYKNLNNNCQTIKFDLDGISFLSAKYIDKFQRDRRLFEIEFAYGKQRRVGDSGEFLVTDAEDLKITITKKSSRIANKSQIIGTALINVIDIVDKQILSDLKDEAGNKVGSLKIHIQTSNADKPLAAELIQSFLNSSLVASLEKTFDITSEVEHVTKKTTDYFLEIKQSSINAHPDQFTLLKINENESLNLDSENTMKIPLKGFPNVSMRFEVFNRKRGVSPNRRKSSKEENRSSLLIFDLSNLLSNTDAKLIYKSPDINILRYLVQHPCHISNDSGSFQWEIKITVEEHEEDSDISKALAEMFVLHQLKAMTDEERYSWDGETWISELQALKKIFFDLLLDGAEFNMNVTKALIQSHSSYPFNNQVFLNLMLTLREEENILEFEHLRQYFEGYARYVARTVMNFDTPKENVPRAQLVYVATCIEKIFQFNVQAKVYFQSYFHHYFLEMYPDFCRSMDGRIILAHGVGIFLPTLKELGKIQPLFSAMLSVEIMKKVIPNLEIILCTNNESLGKVSFQIFKTFREILKYTNGGYPTSRFFRLFDICKEHWAKLIGEMATEQLGRLAKLEKEKHAKVQEADWQLKEWIDDTSDVAGILLTCSNTWREMSWPDIIDQIKFGEEMLENLKNAFFGFLAKMKEIIFDDDIFEAPELVILSVIVSNWSEYLDGFVKNTEQIIIDYGQREEDQVAAQVSGAKAFAAWVKEETDEKMNLFIDEFLASVEKEIRKPERLEALFTPEEDTSSLCYIDKVFEILTEYLSNGENDKKSFDRISREICRQMENIFMERFEKKESKLMKNQDQAASFLVSLNEFIDIEQKLDVPISQEISTIAEVLDSSALTTSEVINSHIKDWEGHFKDEVRGELNLNIQVCNEDNSLDIELLHLKNVKERPKHDYVHPSLEMYVLPKFDKEIASQQTSVYKNLNDVIFGLTGDQSRFNLKLPQSTPHEYFIILELFDNHKSVTSHKVSRGLGAISLKDIGNEMKKFEIKLRCLSDTSMKSSKLFNIVKLRSLISARKCTTGEAVAGEYVSFLEDHVKERRKLMRHSANWIEHFDLID